MTARQSDGSRPLGESLDHEPRALRFGTSGRRGEIVHLTQLEVYVNALAELEYLRSIPRSAGGIDRGDEFFLARDLRPSSAAFVSEPRIRGEIAQAIERAIRDAGLRPVNLGRLPTPALAFYALKRARGCMMVTGSHIPFDRNGYKTSSSRGELLKEEEAPIEARVEQVRRRLYAQPLSGSPFDQRGLFKHGHTDLSPERDDGGETYTLRYTDFFAGCDLAGQRLLVYQHSAVGRDLLVQILRRLGAMVFPAGRSDTFVPIDTENITFDQLARVQGLVDDSWGDAGPFDAIVSTDGDSDRPLILGVEPPSSGETRGPGRVRFFPGDLVGMVVAEYLGCDAVVVPISCNDALDRGVLKDRVAPRTRIGSPYVIAGMEAATRRGAKAVCGWEANGGFLTGSDIHRQERTLSALPTRDAVLPILSVLFAAASENVSLPAFFERLPPRFGRAALLQRFPRSIGVEIVERFSTPDGAIKDALFDEPQPVVLLDGEGRRMTSTRSSTKALVSARRDLSDFFTPERGFDRIVRLNYVDGIRITFACGDVAHFRPSGNADELRIYAAADTQARAEAIAGMGVAEPDGILRQLERAIRGRRPRGATGRRVGARPRRRT